MTYFPKTPKIKMFKEIRELKAEYKFYCTFRRNDYFCTPKIISDIR